jgi:hypothetical protein
MAAGYQAELLVLQVILPGDRTGRRTKRRGPGEG